MKRTFKVFLIINLIFVLIFSMSMNSACSYNEYHVVHYIAGEGGIIEGEKNQIVKEGEATSAVIAVPNEGYYFVEWDDGNINAGRTDKDLIKAVTFKARFERITYECNYYAGTHGRVEGETKQIIYYKENASSVTAIADEGFEFTGWSDGVDTATRNDNQLLQDLNVTAMFGRREKTFKLDYKFGESETNITEINIVYENLEEIYFPIPTREHFTFGGWYIDETKISDLDGKLTAGLEIIDGDETEIYAKWTANETFTFKLLLVYVTEVKAPIPTIDGSRIINVNYKMSDFERSICHELTRQVKLTLDDMLDGLVEFQVDEYFTTVPLGQEVISSGHIGNGLYTHFIDPKNIFEVYDKIEHYNVVQSVFSFNDYHNLLHDSSGMAHSKYGMIHFDSMLKGLYVDQNNLNNLLDDISTWYWDYAVITYIHEMIHSLEDIGPKTSFWHDTMVYYHKQGIVDYIFMEKQFMLNEVLIDGIRVGIPYEYWRNLEL